ncbi:hypothetical protein Mth01_43080 [Sphaerimonospora thailandensis]|uniref:Beta propeller domain-containing protein n=2 Tax=Sphaerimonospora thailandensis TaxID=795644 RepID=A0A8J3RC16_9ACTN|nr:hypothetical protein Mth01_43080 [Sphaerimonospora thailandensis]
MRTAGVLALAGLLTAACSGGRTAPPSGPAEPTSVDLTGQIRLVSYPNCDEMLSGLRAATAEHVTPWGLDTMVPMFARESVAAGKQLPTALSDTGGQSYSTTNVHEAGVDEPDLVKTDGKRLMIVNRGVLRVIDTATRQVTGTLRLVPEEQSWAPADLLVSGDRALVLFEGGGILPFGATAKVRPGPTGPRYVLVDLSGAQPKVLGAMTVNGSHVDARQVGSTVRIVVRSQPEIVFPQQEPETPEPKLLQRNREAVLAAPIDAWLPTYEIESGGASRTERVSCDRVSHPAEFTGTSMLTIHTIDLNGDLNGGLAADAPISVAADGDTVYGTRSSLYVTSNPRWWFGGPAASGEARASGAAEPPERTEVHRFDVSGIGTPRYVASGSVPGRLLNQYSLSENAGNLRVATTSGAEVFGASPGRSESGVYVLNADTLTQKGEVTGLGRGERIYSVRFIGDLGYVVTFRQTDPLYTLDLRDPAAPKVTGELKITGFSAYLHPGGPGRLIGIGQEADKQGRAQGTQISLFDVADPARPRLLSRFHQRDSGSEVEWDPHAFLYWEPSRLAMLPLMNWTGDGPNGSAALVLRVGDDGIARAGLIEHPAAPKPQRTDFAPADQGIRRCVVIGDSVWTVSDLGLKVSAIDTLADQTWIPFT